jgi:hypothetical protein
VEINVEDSNRALGFENPLYFLSFDQPIGELKVKLYIYELIN